MNITFSAAAVLFLLSAFSTSAFETRNEEENLQDHPRRERNTLVSGYHKREVACDDSKCLLRGEGGEDKERFRHRRLSYIKSYSAAMYSYTEGKDAASSTGGGSMDEEGHEEGVAKQAIQVGMELICDPDYAQGDDPCVEGCGHSPVPNPFNPNPVEAENDQVPGPCKNYDCICADSGCSLSWDIGCIKWYMQCQTQTQVCGSLDDAPTAVQSFNIGTSCALAPTSANTAVCFFQELSTPAPTVAPSSSPTDICSVEVEFTCVDAETETIPCGDIETPVDLKCECPEGAMDTLTFYYTGPDGATLDCNSGAFVFTDLTSGMDVVFGPTTEIPESMVCSLSVGGTLFDQFEVDSSCVGSGTLVLEQTFGNNGSGGPILTFDGYTCDSGVSHSCSEEVTYIGQICNPGSGEEVVTSVTLNITADGIVVESVDFTGSPPLGPISGNSCIEFPYSSTMNVCTEFVYEAVLDVEMVPPTTGIPCEGSSTITFDSFQNTLPPTSSPTKFPTKVPTPSPTKAPTEPPVTIVETRPPIIVVPPGDDDDDDDDDDGGKGGKGVVGKGGKKGDAGKKGGGGYYGGYTNGGKKGGYNGFAKGGYYGGLGKKGAYFSGKQGAYSGGKEGGPSKPNKPTGLLPTSPSKPVPISSKPVVRPTGPSKPSHAPLLVGSVPVPVPTGTTTPTSRLPVPVPTSVPAPVPLPTTPTGGVGAGEETDDFVSS